MSAHAPAPLLALTALLLGACDVISRQVARQDTTTIADTVSDTALAIGTDTLTGVPAVPGPAPSIADTGIVQLHPERPRRGGVLFALAEGLAPSSTRCTWKGAPLPCYAGSRGVLAVVPLPAGEPSGTHTLAFEYGTRRLVREVVVAERDFGRELVFLPDSVYRLVQQRQEIARDARALRRLLAAETPQRLWSGSWRDPVVPSARQGYGVERYYHRASDSARAISLASGPGALASFGVDTAVDTRGGQPGWRHSGVDLAARRGTLVRAPAAGMVAGVGEYTLTGRTLVIDHGQGVHSAYFHLDTVLVREGSQVAAGAAIGRVGATGLATGPHLHYGIYVHGRDVDPAAWTGMPPFARDTAAREPARR